MLTFHALHVGQGDGLEDGVGYLRHPHPAQGDSCLTERDHHMIDIISTFATAIVNLVSGGITGFVDAVAGIFV